MRVAAVAAASLLASLLCPAPAAASAAVLGSPPTQDIEIVQWASEVSAVPWARRFAAADREHSVSVASRASSPGRANMLYLAARTHNCAATVLISTRGSYIEALREFWTDWLVTHGNTVLY